VTMFSRAASLGLCSASAAIKRAVAPSSFFARTFAPALRSRVASFQWPSYGIRLDKRK
jgi:hypothetical protein